MHELIPSAYYHIKQSGKYATNYWLHLNIQYTCQINVCESLFVVLLYLYKNIYIFFFSCAFNPETN